MKRRALLTFVKLAIVEKIAFYRNVIEKMTNNPNFATPEVALAVLKAIVDKLEQAYFEYRAGSHVAKANMDNFELEADELFRKQADYVTRIANGDAAIILSAGFEITKEPNPRQIPDFEVKDGEMPGSVKLRKTRVEGAHTYVWQYCANEIPKTDNEWTQAGISTQCSFEIDDLTPGVRYWFRVAVVTIDGLGPYNSPISRIPQ